MNGISFIKAQGGLGLTSPNEDNWSGLVFYVNSTNIPVGFTASNKQIIYSDIEAVNLGVTEAAYPIEYYQIKEFFRLNNSATLYLSFNSGLTYSSGYTYSTGTTTYSEVQDLQIYSGGKLKQIGVLCYNGSGLTYSNDIGALQTIAAALEVLEMPCSIIFGGNTKSVGLSSLSNLRALSASKVSMVIGQDGSATGLSLYNTYGVSVPALGAALGTISLAKVSENIGWVNKFNIKNEGTSEYDNPTFGNGIYVSSQTTTALTNIQNKGYIFLRKFVGLTGTYWNDSPTAVVETSDYAYIENNRVFDKARRGIRKDVLPYVNSPIKIDPTSGKVDITTIKAIENAATNSLSQMLSAEELSGYKVTINPNQNVLSSGILYITVALVPIGVAREIIITLGFVLSV
ncbi:MAG: DUF2586 family protein [archaeon]